MDDAVISIIMHTHEGRGKPVNAFTAERCTGEKEREGRFENRFVTRIDEWTVVYESIIKSLRAIRYRSIEE